MCYLVCDSSLQMVRGHGGTSYVCLLSLRQYVCNYAVHLHACSMEKETPSMAVVTTSGFFCMYVCVCVNKLVVWRVCCVYNQSYVGDQM